MSQLPQLTIADVLPGFLDYIRVERSFSSATIRKYRSDIDWFLRDVGNLPVSEIELTDFIALKARMAERKVGEARVTSVICAMKSLLAYVRDVLRRPVVDLATIRAPKRMRRKVSYLSNEELDLFLQSIPLRTWAGKPRLAGIRFRALVETLAATGMRISEALSLNRDTIDWEQQEAKIIGKGNKERTVFFSDRAIQWLQRYLDLRPDGSPALFATAKGERLQCSAAEAAFRRNTQFAEMGKRVTPHVIRHTTATNLLRNGCPMGYIKEALGHERLETTCRFYLGMLSEADTKRALRTYLNYEVDRDAPASQDPSAGPA